MKEMARWLAAAVVFACCCGIGFWIAGQKPLWNDELYSLTSSIDSLDPMTMIRGKISEGNNTPLFYLVQKGVVVLSGYDVPGRWKDGDWAFRDREGELLLRIFPVICMSLSMALVFKFFVSRFSWMAGLLSLFVYASSYMVWVYWAEARPYALIVLLTTLQALVLISLSEDKTQRFARWPVLAFIHLLLSFTFIVSIGQIAAASMVLFLKGLRQWRAHLLLLALPMAVALFYYYHAPKYDFHFHMSPEQLIRDNISRDRFYIFLGFLVCAAVGFLAVRKNLKWKIQWAPLAEAGYFYAYFLLTFLAAVALLLMFYVNQTPDKGFAVSNRYFIYLMPLGVMASVWGVLAVFKSMSAHRMVQAAVLVGVAILLVGRFNRIVPSALSSITGGG